MTQHYVLFFDGACEPRNPGGIATYGFQVAANGREPLTDKGVVGEGRGMTNNVAEYHALIQGLNSVKQQAEEGDTVEVIGDSQLVIKQMTGAYKVRSQNIIPLFARARKLRDQLRGKGVRVCFKWVSRDENAVADALSHAAFEEYCREKGYLFSACECGGTLVPRKNTKTGHRFLGCSRFPKCRRTSPFPDESRQSAK